MLMDGESLAHLWKLLLPTDSPAALAINHLILTLFLAGVLDALAALGLLVREQRRIHHAVSALETAGSRRPALSIEGIVELLGVPANSTVAERVARALQLRTARMGGLQQTTSSHLDRYGLLSRYIAGILTLVGLLGTVLGLSFALFKIQGALMGIDEVEKLQDFTEALGSTLRGMKTAFACTLAGLSTSLLLSLLNHAVRRFQVSLAERLDDFTFRGLLPFFERLDPGADQAAKGFARKLQDSAQELEKVRETVTSAAAQTGAASTSFTAAVDKLEGILSSFASSIATLAENQQGFTQALAEMRDAARHLSAGIETHSARLAGLANEHGTALHASSDVLVDLGLNLGALFEKQAVADSAESHRQLLATLQGFPDHFKPMLVEHQGQLKAFMASIREELERSSAALVAKLDQEYREQAGEQMKSQGKAYEEALRRSIQEMEKLIKLSEERLRSLFESQGSTLRTVSDMVVDFHNNVSPHLDRAFTGNGRPATPGR
jgi:hypothetical protein